MKSKLSLYPKVSIVLLTCNGGVGVDRVLKSVKRLTYPKDKLQIIVSDNNSFDDSVKRARRYVNKVFISDANVYAHRAEAMRRTDGEFIYMILEQDMEIKSKNFLEKMIKPLIENKNIAASFTREYPNDKMPPITRYLSYNPSQCDPLFEYLTPSIESTIVSNHDGYYICEYHLGNIPPTTHMLYRKKFLTASSVWSQRYDYDHDTLIKMVRSGYSEYAYVPDAGIYHYHAVNFKELIGKRLRNLDNHYFPKNDSLQYSWMDFSNRQQVLKVFVWLLYIHLFFPALLRGVLRSIKYRDWVLILEPIVALTTTDAILYKFFLNSVGRKLIVSSLKALIVGG